MNEMTKVRGTIIRKLIKTKIIEYITEHGYAPTVREIADMVALKSTSSVQNHLQKMFEKGELETDAGHSSPRAIRIPGYTVTNERYIPLEGMYHTGRQVYIKEGDETKDVRAGYIREEKKHEAVHIKSKDIQGR